MSETYSLVLNSQNSTNIVDNSSLGSYKYNIRWDSILPRIDPNKKYNVSWQLKTLNLNTTFFNASMATPNILTVVTITSGSILIGTQFIANNIIQTVTALGTGTGGAGTYTISPGNITLGATNFYAINNPLSCSVNFGYTTSYDQTNSQISRLGYITPSTNIVANNANVLVYNYSASVTDNGPVVIGYPSNQVITVSFNQLDGTTLFNLMPHYQLKLFFEPIE